MNLSNINYATSLDEARDKVAELDKRFGDTSVGKSPYLPNGFYSNLEKYLPEMTDILNTTTGKKLKDLAEPPSLLSRLRGN